MLIFAPHHGVTALYMHVKRRLQLDWRRWLTDLLREHRLAHGHLYRPQFTAGEHDNPTGHRRDIRIATIVAVSLAHSLPSAPLILGSFIDIPVARLGQRAAAGDLDHGAMATWVLAAFLYAGVGAALGLMLGRPPIRATNRPADRREANLRFGLARASTPNRSR